MIRQCCLFVIFISFWIVVSVATVTAENNKNYRLRLNKTANANFNSTDDVKAEIQFGRELAARILGNYPYYEHKRLSRYVNLVGQSLLKNSNRPELSYYFAVLDTDDVNAFSAPGGYIFITLGALKMMSNEAELAAVLAHEIAHITERHIVNDLHIRAQDQSSVTRLGAILGGSTKSVEVAFTQSVDKAIAVLFKKGFKIDQENNADNVATMMLASAGYDPYALYRFLRKVDAYSKSTNKHKPTTHPLTKDRLAAICRFVTKEKLTALNSHSLKKRFIKNVFFHK